MSKHTGVTIPDAVDWRELAVETMNALRTFNAFYDDLASSNPGFMGKLCLQDYSQWNEALMKSAAIKRKYKDLWNFGTEN